MRREQPLQEQLSAVSAQLFAVHLLWWTQKGKTMWYLKTWCIARFFLFHSENSYVRKNIVVHSTIYYCRCNIYFHILCLWSIDGKIAVQLWHPSAMNRTVSNVNKTFFSNTYPWVTVGKVCFVIWNIASYFKQYLCCVSK